MSSRYSADEEYRARLKDIAWDPGTPPFSFCYGGRDSKEFLAQWKLSDIAVPRDGIRRCDYSDPDTGLTVTALVWEHPDFQAVDWVLELANDGEADAPLIEDVLPLDLTLPMSKRERYFLHYAKGSSCRVDDFLPVTEELRSGKADVAVLTLAPRGGRPSDGVLPFMNVQLGLLPGRGFALAIGWTGQWQATFARGARGDHPLRVTAGMQHTRLRLRPGEKIRTPRILVVNWEGEDPIVGSNRLRQLLLQHYVPRHNGAVVLPPVAHNTIRTFLAKGNMAEPDQVETIQREASLGIEAHWIDAYWFGSGRAWPEELGNWQVRGDLFPRGVRPVSDAAHRGGARFVLWFEPERVHPDSALAREHPEFLLHSTEVPDFRLIDLGLPEARRYITDLVSKLIAEHGVDIYRQGFNRPPLSFWRQADEPEREGMTEIRYVEGLYAFWDELRSHHPGLVIDNCAAGGRRIDLETISRSVPLWRSDFTDAIPADKDHQVADQVQTAGLSRWVPLHTGPVWHPTFYDFLSAMAAGIVVYSDVCAQDFPVETARRAIALLKELRPCFLGDFYPLIPLTVSSHDWCAYQYHRQEEGDGFAVVFRRHRSPFPTAEIGLREVREEREYDVSMSDSFDDVAPRRTSGQELSRLALTIHDAPGALLLRYVPVVCYQPACGGAVGVLRQ